MRFFLDLDRLLLPPLRELEELDLLLRDLDLDLDFLLDFFFSDFLLDSLDLLLLLLVDRDRRLCLLFFFCFPRDLLLLRELELDEDFLRTFFFF